MLFQAFESARGSVEFVCSQLFFLIGRRSLRILEIILVRIWACRFNVRVSGRFLQHLWFRVQFLHFLQAAINRNGRIELLSWLCLIKDQAVNPLQVFPHRV